MSQALDVRRRGCEELKECSFSKKTTFYRATRFEDASLWWHVPGWQIFKWPQRSNTPDEGYLKVFSFINSKSSGPCHIVKFLRIGSKKGRELEIERKLSESFSQISP